MKNLNNKGQSLVLFVLFVPLLLGVMALVVDLGNALVKKSEIDSVVEMVLESELKNTYIDDSTLNNIDNNTRISNIEVLLDYNLELGDYSVLVSDDVIVIKVNTYVEGIFSRVLNIRGFKIISEYKGYLESTYIEKIK